MAAITFKGQTLEISSEQSVLEALLAAGRSHPNSCRSGACQACLARAIGAAPPPASQTGLSASLKQQGYFLTCQARGVPDGFAFASADDLPAFKLRVVRVQKPCEDVAQVFLAADEPVAYEPGQFIQLSREDGLTRSYSLASVPSDGHLELHVRHVSGGAMSSHLFAAAPGARFLARGPSGNCFYVPGSARQPLLLAATGTGLAPLLGIARQALAAGHTGAVTLIHGARSVNSLYADETLRALARSYSQFTYTACVRDEPSNAHQITGDINEVVLAYVRNNIDARVFLCGPPEFVTGLRRKVFLAGVPLQNILSDAFVMAKPS